MTDEPFEVERGLLSCILQDGDVAVAIDIGVKVSDFLLPAHATLYNYMVECHSRGIPSYFVSVRAMLESVGQINSIGGYSYLKQLKEWIPTSNNLEYYAMELVDQSVEMGRISDKCH